MTPEIEERILAHMDMVEAARKTFDRKPVWQIVEGSGRGRCLSLRAAVRLNGVLAGGASIFLTTPENAWESDVYGHVDVRFPQITGHLRIAPLEWRPLRLHVNPPDSPETHRFHRLTDRWHPYGLNRPRGIPCLRQSTAGVAVEPPRAISNFEEYCEVAADIWHCPDMYGLPRPEWTETLL